MAKRQTDMRDYDRLAESIMTKYPSIKTKDDFNSAFDQHTAHWKRSDETLDTMKMRTLRAYRSRKYIEDQEETFEKAGGKNLARDRKTDAQVIVTGKKDYTNAQKQDLRGLDTKRYDTVGYYKKKVIYGEKQEITIRGKKRTILRASNGRFSSFKEPKQ